MTVPFEVLEQTPSALYGICGGIWVMTVCARPTAKDMHRARPALRTMSLRFPDGFPTLTWVLPEAGYNMDSESRKVATDVTRDFDRSILAQATLIQGTGFQSAAVRAILTGMELMIRSTGAKKVFSELPAAVTWCLGFQPAAHRDAGAVPAISDAIQRARVGLTPAA